VCDAHPEFGYVGSASVRHKLGFVLAFVVLGLVAGASGVAVFIADFDRDPKHAMALAPAEALVETTSPISTAETEVETKSSCRKDIRDSSVGDCTSGKNRKQRSILALNERPAIAAVAIGHRDDPAVLPTESAAPVVAAAPEIAVTATPTETPPAVPASPASLPEGAVTVTPPDTPSTEPTPPASAPAVASKRGQLNEREHREYARYHREHREYASTPRYHREQREHASAPLYYSSRQVYQSAGYARLW
jgi:hypothetical protein